MITEKVGRFATRFPWLGIAIILLITGASMMAQVLMPMEESFDQEDFMPDMEVAIAHSEYQDKFTSTYTYIVLVRSDDDDMVTKQGFLDTINLSNEIAKDPTFQEWRDPAEQGAYPISPPFALFQMRQAVDFAEDLSSTGSSFNDYYPYIMTTNASGSTFSTDIASANLSDDNIVSSMITDLRTDLDDLIEGTELQETSGADPVDAQGYFESIPDDQGLKTEIGSLLSYNFSDPKIFNATMSLMRFSSLTTPTIEQLDGAIGSVDEALADERISNSTKASLQDLRTDLEGSIERLQTLLSIANIRGNPLGLGQMTQYFYFGQFILINFLTEDFDPMNGEFSAEGCMILLNLDYILNEMRDSDPDGLRDIEGEISKVVNKADDGSDLVIHPLAFAQIDQKINDASNESMMILLPLALLFVLIILSVIYRNIFDMILNIIALSMAIIWMYGFGSVMGYSSNPMITAVPVLIMGLGIDYGIHLTMRYREEIRKGKTVKESLHGMSGSVGMALLLATFTTVFAFLSNIFSPVGLIVQFGVMAAVGITASFIIMVIFVPSVKGLRDVRRAKKGKPLFQKFKEGECDLCEKEENNKKIVNRIILGMSLRAERHPAIILTAVAIITLGMFGAALNSEIVFDVKDFLPDDLQESKDLSYMFTEFNLGGSGDLGIILVEGDISDPEVLRSMNDTMAAAVALNSEYISMEGEGANIKPNADFILYSLKETASMIGAMDPSNPFVTNYSATFDFSTGLPRNSASSDDILIVLDMFYEQFPSEARKVIYKDGQNYTMAAIAFTVGTEDDKDAWGLYDELQLISEPLEEGEDSKITKVSETGTSIVMAVVINALQDSQINSLIITIIVSLVVLTIVFFWEERSIILGLVATLPVVFCVVWIVGTMWLVGISLNVMTITIGSLTIGLGITYGIHITHRFVEDIKLEKDLLEASKNTLVNTGSALFGAAATTVVGFGLLTFATMPPLQQFGQVTALAIIYSFISSVVVLPVLLIIWAKVRRRYRGKTGKKLSYEMENSESSPDGVN